MIVTLVALGAGATLVILSLWLFNNLRLQSVFDEAAIRPDVTSSVGAI